MAMETNDANEKNLAGFVFEGIIGKYDVSYKVDSEGHYFMAISSTNPTSKSRIFIHPSSIGICDAAYSLEIRCKDEHFETEGTARVPEEKARSLYESAQETYEAMLNSSEMKAAIEEFLNPSVNIPDSVDGVLIKLRAVPNK